MAAQKMETYTFGVVRKMKIPPQIKSFSHIAIVQTAFLGDTALALYLAQNIKILNPNSKITFVTAPAAKELIMAAKCVDCTVVFEKRTSDKGLLGIKKKAEFLNKSGVDCIIAPHRSLRTTLLCHFSKASYTVGFDKNAVSFLYDKRVKYPFHIHEVFRNNSLLSAFSDGIEMLHNIPKVEFDISAANNSTNNYVRNEIIDTTKDNIVLLAPGSVWETKRWLPEYFSSLAKKIAENGYECFVIGGEQDRRLANQIAQESGSKALAGDLSLLETLELMKRSRLLVTNDSAPTHLAGLAGCKTITIYGATSPKFGFHPLGEKDISIVPSDLKCHPCAIHGSRKCPLGTLACMYSTKPEKVAEICFEILKK